VTVPPASDSAARGSSCTRAAAPDAASPEELDLLMQLVAIPSFSGEEQRAAAWLVSRLEALGVESTVDEVGNVVAVIAPSASESVDGDIYLLGHLDTVDGFWPPTLVEGRLSGRGSSDAKGPLAAFIAAAVRARVDGRLRRRVHILAAVEEETSSRGAAHLARTLLAPVFLVVGEPSGWDHLVLGYRGSAHVSIRVECAAGHSSRPDATAAELAVGAWAAVEQLSDKLNGGAVGFNALNAHLLGIESGSDGLVDFATLHIGFRLPARIPGSVLMETLGQLDHVTMQMSRLGDAVLVPRTGPLPTAFATAIRQHRMLPVWQRRLGTSDLNVVLPKWRCPAVVYGPGSAELDHTPYESLEINDYGRAIHVLTSVLIGL